MSKTSLHLSHRTSAMGKVTLGFWKDILFNKPGHFHLVWCCVLTAADCTDCAVKVISGVVCMSLHRLTRMLWTRQRWCYFHRVCHVVMASPLLLGLLEIHSLFFPYTIISSEILFILLTAMHLRSKPGTTEIGLISWTRTLFDLSREEYDYLQVSWHI